MWSPGDCAKISGRSRASVTGQGRFGGTKFRVAGLLGALHIGKFWKRVQGELKDAARNYAIDSTKAWFGISMSICFWLIYRGERDRSDFRKPFLQHFQRSILSPAFIIPTVASVCG